MSELLFTRRMLSFSTQSLEKPENDLRRALADKADTQIWGIWHGLFGVAANQLILMTAHSKPEDDWQGVAGGDVVSEQRLRPTVRPESATPLDRPGIYVFRDFGRLPQPSTRPSSCLRRRGKLSKARTFQRSADGAVCPSPSDTAGPRECVESLNLVRILHRGKPQESQVHRRVSVS